jgi:hypothetical protein
MQTRIRELRGPAVLGSCAVLGGAAVWQLGIELERAWMRSYDGPLLGESLVGDTLDSQRAAEVDAASPATDGERRWVSEHDRPRLVPRVTRMARLQRS